MPPTAPPSVNEWLLNTWTCWAGQCFAFNVAALDIYRKPPRMQSETVMVEQEMHNLLWFHFTVWDNQNQPFQTLFFCEKTRNDRTAQNRELSSNTFSWEWILNETFADDRWNIQPVSKNNRRPPHSVKSTHPILDSVPALWHFGIDT